MLEPRFIGLKRFAIVVGVSSCWAMNSICWSPVLAKANEMTGVLGIVL